MPKKPNLDNIRVRRILAAAKALFLSQSYAATSTDDIARQAHVSKGTIYAHFDGKEALFSLVISLELGRISDELGATELTTGALEDSLREIAGRFLSVFLSSDAIDLYRVVVNEAPHFPQFGRQFYDEGPRRLVDALSAFLRQADAAGRLALPDPEIAAIQFISLVRADLVLKSALRVEEPTAERCKAIVDAAVGLFLRAHRLGLDTSAVRGSDNSVTFSSERHPMQDEASKAAQEV